MSLAGGLVLPLALRLRCVLALCCGVRLVLDLRLVLSLRHGLVLVLSRRATLGVQQMLRLAFLARVLAGCFRVRLVLIRMLLCQSRLGLRRNFGLRLVLAAGLNMGSGFAAAGAPQHAMRSRCRSRGLEGCDMLRRGLLLRLRLNTGLQRTGVGQAQQQEPNLEADERAHL